MFKYDSATGTKTMTATRKKHTVSRCLPDKATRNHIGYNKMLDNMKRQGKSTNIKVLNTLIVNGTLDTLAKTRYHTKEIEKPHPTDDGYFKRVYVLTSIGQQAFAQARARSLTK